MMAFLGYAFLGLAGLVLFLALVLWWDFCAWRRTRGRDLAASHWLTDGDYTDSTTTEDAE